MTPHVEKYFMASDTVRDIGIGMSDGLTVPFALAAGLSGAVALTSIVVTAGLAEIAAGSIAMGLGGYQVIAVSDLRVFQRHIRAEKTVSGCAQAEYFYKNASAGQNVALSFF
jgi:hypothetical protein